MASVQAVAKLVDETKDSRRLIAGLDGWEAPLLDMLVACEGTPAPAAATADAASANAKATSFDGPHAQPGLCICTAYTLHQFDSMGGRSTGGVPPAENLSRGSKAHDYLFAEDACVYHWLSPHVPAFTTVYGMCKGHSHCRAPPSTT